MLQANEIKQSKSIFRGVSKMFKCASTLSLITTKHQKNKI